MPALHKGGTASWGFGTSDPPGGLRDVPSSSQDATAQKQGLEVESITVKAVTPLKRLQINYFQVLDIKWILFFSQLAVLRCIPRSAEPGTAALPRWTLLRWEHSASTLCISSGVYSTIRVSSGYENYTSWHILCSAVLRKPSLKYKNHPKRPRLSNSRAEQWPTPAPGLIFPKVNRESQVPNSTERTKKLFLELWVLQQQKGLVLHTPQCWGCFCSLIFFQVLLQIQTHKNSLFANI